ncbi:MAG: SgcJ/EcaC family oxidoreductase [Burkholderiales bacterium]
MQNDEQAIRDLVSTWMLAAKEGDIEKVLSLMTDDVVFLIAGHPPIMGKAAYAVAAKPPPGQQPPKFDGKSEIQEINVTGDWAYVWTKLTVVVHPPGGAPAMTRAGHTLTVLKKQNGIWLLARDANMLTPIPK